MFTPLTQLSLLAVLHLLLAAWSVYHILLFKRDPRAAMAWLMVCVFFPFFGPVSYFLFGINRVRTRAANVRRSFLAIDYEGAARRTYVNSAEIPPGVGGIGQRITGLELLPGNSVAVFQNGDQAYPAMLEAIANAARHVLLSTYIFKVDTVGNEFAQALAAATARDVDVRVLIDGVGEYYSWRKPVRFLQQKGVEAARFLPPRLLPPSVHLNLRNHRKVMVVDSSVAYVGGMNISAQNVSQDGEPARIADTHFSLRGPVVEDLAGLFIRDYQFTTGRRIAYEHGKSEAQANASCRVIADGPDGDLDAIILVIQSVISAATESVDILTPYFLPGREIMSALQSASLKGVRVRIVLPGTNNLFYMQWANRNVLAELLQLGIQVFYQPGSFCHSKLLVIDNDYSLIGSANLDSRSLRLNFELGIEIFSATLNSELRAQIDGAIAASRRLQYDELASRSVPVRLRDSLASLMSPYL